MESTWLVGGIKKTVIMKEVESRRQPGRQGLDFLVGGSIMSKCKVSAE